MPVEETEKLYKEIGDKLKKDFKNFTAWIITSAPGRSKECRTETIPKDSIVQRFTRLPLPEIRIVRGYKKDP